MTMNVDQINTLNYGGASVAAFRLHESLREEGVRSRYWHNPGKRARNKKARPLLPECGPISWQPRLTHPIRRLASPLHSSLLRLVQKRQLKRALKNCPPDLELFSVPWQEKETCLDIASMESDVLHLHWITWMVDVASFFSRLPDDLPIVWTMHDMNAITGGCHHADDCQSFTNQCGCCPQLGISGKNDISSQAFKVKQKAYRNKNIHVVTPSRWLEKHVLRSSLMESASSIQTIHNGLDLNVFSPQDKNEARRKLNLPTDRFIICFGAESLKRSRKGMMPLQHALARLPEHEKVLGLGFGASELPRFDQPIPEIQLTGFLSDPETQATVYSAADLFVLPSLGENMPQTVVEAMACGTPVVSFAVGGVPEIVKPMQTGLLAKTGCAKELADRIQWMVANPDARKKMGRASRELALQEFDLRKQTQKYIALYQNVMSSKRQLSKVG